MITENAAYRVFRIYHNKKTASAYTIEKGTHQFLVSAAHAFSGDQIVDVHLERRHHSSFLD